MYFFLKIQQNMDQELINEIQSKQILHWNARNFDALPLELLDHGSHIKEIYVRWNNIHHLPPWMGCSLQSLTNLYLEFNKLSNLPSELSLLKNLRVLQLDNNNLFTIPDVVFQLQRLKSLSLSRNLIEWLPSEIRALKNLERLDLSNNLVQVLPSELSYCRKLKDLLINNNKLLYLPRNITQMASLDYINAASNMLHFMPAVQFCSSPVIDVSFNYNLNWCSLQALDQKLINVNYTGKEFDLSNRCDSWTLIQCDYGQQCVEVACCGTTQNIFLPTGLHVYNMKESKIPPLFELALRKAYKIVVLPKPLEDSEDIAKTGVYCGTYLPSEIFKTLIQGPTAICTVCQCGIFQHSFCSLSHSHILQIPHCLVFLCSRSCAISYFNFQSNVNF